MPDIDLIHEKLVPLESIASVPDEILSMIGEAQFVLLGEASHGTQEFYRFRAEITKRLLTEKGFSGIAVEADFPDAYRVNRYVRRNSSDGNDRTAAEALGDFQRFPLWMWRNGEVLDFVEWLRDHNQKLTADRRIGFYGIDLYSLHASAGAVLKYLEKIDREAAKRARYRYSCFDHHGEDAQSYGYAAGFDLNQSCRNEVVSQLVELQRRAAEYANRDGFAARDEYFFAEQNARLVKNAEEYYRQMFRGQVSSWNLRDRHMTETLEVLAAHLGNQGLSGKVVVWAHNSHLGDASATEMSRRGEWNVGQLMRENFGRAKVRIIGFTTYTGTVTATTNWDEPAQLKKVRPGLTGSVEELFHESGIPNFFLNLQDEDLRSVFAKPLLERAIGVIYRPATERLSHYFQTYLADQFDAVIHFDRTTALEPLDVISSWSHEDAPETFPVGV